MCYYIVCIPSWLVQPAEVLFHNAEVPQTEYPGILPFGSEISLEAVKENKINTLSTYLAYFIATY